MEQRYHPAAKQAAAVGFLVVGSLLLTGCGNELAQVSGVVTMDGEPLRGGDRIHATVYFQPASGEGTSAAGVIDENGEYQLSTGSQRGIPPGEYVVTFSATEMIPPQDGGSTYSGRRISDPKYASVKTSGIRFEVEEGNNQFDIPIESAPPALERR